MKATMSFLFLCACVGMDVDVHDGGGDGGGGEPPPWKQPGFHIGALDDLPDWAAPDESHLNETTDFPTPFLRPCLSCGKHGFLRKGACANPRCDLFYMFLEHWDPKQKGRGKGQAWNVDKWNAFWNNRDSTHPTFGGWKPYAAPKKNRGVKRRENLYWKDR